MADIYAKSVGTLPVTRPTLRGSRIAQSDRTSNTEAHAVYVYTPTLGAVPKRQTPMRAVQYTPIDIYCCNVLDQTWKFARFQSVKHKAPSKRFLYIYPPPAADAASAEGHCKNIKLIEGKKEKAVIFQKKGMMSPGIRIRSPCSCVLQI